MKMTMLCVVILSEDCVPLLPYGGLQVSKHGPF